MNRGTVLNVFLGLVLILVFAVLFAAGLGAIAFAFYVIDLAAKRFLPGLPHSSDLEFYSLLSLVWLISGIMNLRKRLWRSAFLSLATIPAIVSVWLANPHSPAGRDSFWSIWIVAILLATAQKSSVPRSEFFLGAAIVSVILALNTGLLGFGVFAHAAWSCTVVAAIALFVIPLRRIQSSNESKHPATPSAA